MVWLLIAGLAWAPFWYGGNILIMWGVNAVIFPGLAAIYEISLLVRGAKHPVGIRQIAIPAMLFAAVVAWMIFQTITADWIPFVHPIWALASEALGRPLRASISLNRSLTEITLLKLITDASVFWLSLQLLRNGARALLFVKAIAVIVSIYACYGLATLVFGQFPWSNISMAEGRVSATFANYNSYATYAGLGLLTATGLIADRFRETVRETSSAWRLQAVALIDLVSFKAPWLAAAVFVTAVTLMLSGSRGGALATAVRFLCFALFRPRRSRRPFHVRLFGLILGGGLVFAIVLAFGDALLRRVEMGGLFDPNRLAVYRLTWRSIFDETWQGFGYGTFVDVFPMYRDSSLGIQNFWSQAHNTYLEIFQGLGFVFGTMFILSVALLGFRCVRGVWNRRENAVIPRIAAAATALVGFHSLVDFSMEIHAVAITFMAILGAGVAQSISSRMRASD